MWIISSWGSDDEDTVLVGPFITKEAAERYALAHIGDEFESEDSYFVFFMNLPKDGSVTP